MYHSQVSKPGEEEGSSDRGMSPQLQISIETTAPMLMAHPPPDAAWPQASPRLAPWVPYVSAARSW